MKTHFSQIFWGLILVFLDFSINGLDLLFDGLGYLLIAIGCGGLSSSASRFAVARVLSLILVLLWFVGFFVDRDLAGPYALAMNVVNAVMVWQLLSGIAAFSQARGRHDLANQAINRRLAYALIQTVFIATPYLFGNSREMAPLAYPLVLAFLIIMVMILHLIYRVGASLVESSDASDQVGSLA